jgi:hypothetical protein
MTTTDPIEPESLLEVRRWKEAAGQELEALGFEEFHRRADKEFADLRQRMDIKRQARSLQEHKPAA